MELITEEVDPIGSCCDNGRIEFRDCGNFWWYCKEWGVKNFTKWIQFGKTGLTMPISTEHQATCHYSKTITQCPLPMNCTIRIPINKKDECIIDFNARQNQSTIEIYNSGVCTRIPIIRTEGNVQNWLF